MKQFIVVALACAAIVTFVAIHKPAGALIVGIVVGAWYFLGAMARGGGIAKARITRDPGEPRKPGDPAGSIGMGLAASGIAASFMQKMADPSYPESLRIWYIALFAGGLLIALAYAGKTLLMEIRSGKQADKEQS